jgi:hypothetical protein
LDVTFCSNTFSYKKLFNPTSYTKVMPVLPRHKDFLQKNQNSCLVFFLLTRSHNITKSYFLIFFQIFYHFILFFRRLERRSTGGVGGGGGGVAGQNCKKDTRSAPQCLCATGKFSNFEFFCRRFKLFDGKVIHGAPFSVPVAHLVVRYG